MTYKFKQENASFEMEVEFLPSENMVNFQLTNLNTGKESGIDINKEDVYKLIGVLHLLHKEMK